MSTGKVPPCMTLWQSPSGRLHKHSTCSGAGPRNRVKRVHVTSRQFEAALSADMVCRCVMNGWKADEGS
jgi:hypothetical protein